MRSLFSLWQSDRKAVVSWIRQHTVAKVFVIVCFTLLGLGVSLFIYAYFSIFFRSMVLYEIFGVLTAQYIVNASMMVVTWLGIMSAVFASLVIWNRNDRKMQYLNTLPVPVWVIFVYTFLPTLVTSGILLLLTGGPVVFAFNQVFGQFPWVAALVEVTLFSQAIGTLLALGLLKAFLRFGQKTGWLSLVGFVALSVVLVKLLFPDALRALYFSTPENFFEIFRGLPLVKLAGINLPWVGGLSGSLIILILSWWWQSRNWVSLRNSLQSRPQQNTQNTLQEMKWLGIIRKRMPLVYKDLLSVLRVRTESAYGVFLLGMVIFFFVVLKLARSSRPFDRVEEIDLVLFSLAWLWFFATAYWLRLVFPLTAREGQVRWWYLTLPIKRSEFLVNKIMTGLLFSLPLLILVAFLGVFWPFGMGRELVWFSLIAFVPMTVLSVCLGTIKPNFAESQSAEKISTSGMGLVNLGINGILTLVWVGLIRNSFSSGNTLIAMGSVMLLLLILTAVVWNMAKLEIEKADLSE